MVHKTAYGYIVIHNLPVVQYIVVSNKIWIVQLFRRCQAISFLSYFAELFKYVPLLKDAVSRDFA
jgi:hypothetical protein